jgi:hypothetical protein
VVERIIGNDEVESPILSGGTTLCLYTAYILLLHSNSGGDVKYFAPDDQNSLEFK